MKPSLLIVVVLLSAEISSVISLVTLQNPIQNRITDLEAFIPSHYRAPRAPLCDMVVLSEIPTHWNSSLRPVKVTSNFSHVGLVTKCTFLHVFCNDQNPHEVVQRTHKFILLQGKLIQKIWVVVLFLQDNYKDHHVTLERLTQGIKKRVVFVSNGRRIKHKSKARNCEAQDLKCALEGLEVSVAYSQNKPYIYLKNWTGVDDPRNQQLILSPRNVRTAGAELIGTEAKLLKFICEQYNLTLRLRMYDYGTGFPNGTWVGMLGVVKAGKADIAVGRLPGSFRRNQIAHHSSYVFYYCFNIVSLKPGLLSSLFAPLRPFTHAVWYSIGISMVLVGVSLWLVARFRAWLFDFNSEITTLRAIELVLNALLNVPWSGAHNQTPKFLAGMWLLMAAILQASYNSRLMLSYSILEYEKSPDTVQDLISMGRTALVLNGGTSSSILSRYDQLHVERLPTEVTPAQLTATKVTIYDPTNYMFKIVDYGGRPLSDFYFGRKPILQIFAGWLYSFQFDLTHEIDLAILRAGQVGLLDKWTKEQQTLLRQQEEAEEGRDARVEFKNVPITLWNLQALFLLFVVGHALATVAFIVENIIGSSYYKKRSYWIQELGSLG